ncbi:unnamed protein product [Urochloa humidicola]
MPRNACMHHRMSEWMAASAAEAVLARTARRCGGCDMREDTGVEALLQWQKVGDLLIALSLLSIPMELLYFATCAAVTPLHELSSSLAPSSRPAASPTSSTPRPGSRRVLVALTATKAIGVLATAAVASLLVFFPRLLRVKACKSLCAKARCLDRDLSTSHRCKDTIWCVVRAVARALRNDAIVGIDVRAIRCTTMLQLAVAIG